MKKIIKAGLLASLLISCSTVKKVALEEFVIEAETYQKTSYKGTDKRIVDVLHTDLEVNFNWEKAQLNGKAKIIAKPYFYPIDTVVLDAKGFDIYQVQLNNVDVHYYYDSVKLHIVLPETLVKTDTFELFIDYTAKPNDLVAGSSDAITDEKGLYFINKSFNTYGYMPQIWTQGETESNSCWFPTNDSPSEKMTQKIAVEVDSNFTVLSNGTLISKNKLQNSNILYVWEQKQAQSPYLTMLTVGDFKIVHDFWNNKPVNYYVESAWEHQAKSIFGATPEMMTFFSNLLNYQYPWDKYSQVVVRDYVSGAMENTTATIHGDFLYRTKNELVDKNNESIIAHELFHHWFGDLVTCESWANLPLNESFANYSEVLWQEYKYGIDAMDYYGVQEESSYFYEHNNGDDKNLIRFYYENETDMFDSHSYNKGGRILNMLRSYLGDDAFFTGLNIYLNSRAYKTAEVHHLRMAFEEACGEDLNWFFNQWFLASGNPDILITYEINDEKLTVFTEQQQNLELFPLYKIPVEITYGNKNEVYSKRIWINNVNDTNTILLNTTVDMVIFNSNNALLAKLLEVKEMNLWVNQLNYSERYINRKVAFNELVKVNSGLDAKDYVLTALNDDFWHLRYLALKFALNDEVLAQNEVILSKVKTLLNDENSTIRNLAINYLYQSSLYTNNQLIPVLNDKLLSDSSDVFLGNMLTIYNEIDSLAAYKYALNVKNVARGTNISDGIAQVFISNKNKKDIDFFSKTLFSDQASFSFSQYYAAYVSAFEDEQLINHALADFANYIQGRENDYEKLAGYYGINAVFGIYLEKYEALKATKNPNAIKLSEYGNVLNTARNVFLELYNNETNEYILNQFK